ncbi:MAG: uroporphyrinogen decarboxylase, partial [Planctomycetaceae bacterium]|nr:uroporphyrinogen decarboxylase [Planctomycetaceae bacterium]
YQKGEGPVIHNPLRDATEVDRVRELEDVESLGFVFDAVRMIRRDLPADIPLLGFAGAPFTMASYAIEGGGSKSYIRTKKLMWNDRPAWDALMNRLVASTVRYLTAQIEAGCQAVQVFDSWAGCLSPTDYREYVLPYTRKLIAGLPPDVPVINFLTGNPALLESQVEAGGQVLGIDWRVDLAAARQAIGPARAVQGNLDPISLYCDLPTLEKRALAVLETAGRVPGHIFNLGHGVLPDVPHKHVKALVRMVHELGAAR